MSRMVIETIFGFIERFLGTIAGVNRWQGKVTIDKPDYTLNKYV